MRGDARDAVDAGFDLFCERKKKVSDEIDDESRFAAFVDIG